MVASGATVVIRPDSGDPKTVCVSLVDILGEKFGYTTNGKGYKVLNNVRLIQVGNNTALLRRSCGVWCVDLTSPHIASHTPNPPTCAPACVPPPRATA